MGRNYWKILKITRAIILLLLIAFVFIYITTFKESLTSGDWVSSNGYTFIVIPDTFLYSDLVNVDSLFETALLSGVKNSIVPSLLWIVAGFDWVTIGLINIGIAYLITFYMNLLAKHYDILCSKAELAALIFLILPTTFYYSIGALKELPMALCLVAGFYYINLRKIKIFSLILLALVLTRYQMAVIFIILFIAKYNSKTVLNSVLIMVGLSVIYPLISSLDLLSQDTTALYRKEYGVVGSMGSMIENVRNNIYGLSVLAISIRIFQSLFEPIIGFIQSGSVHDGADLSIYRLMHVISNIMVLPYLYLFFKKLKTIIFYKAKIAQDVQLLNAFLIICLISIGGFSFVHGRYILPFMPLIIIASLIPHKRMGNSPDKRK